MKKILALFAVAALAVPAFADDELTVTDAVLGDIEATAKVVTGVSIDLSAYAKIADVASDARVDAIEAKTNDWNTAAAKAATALQPGDETDPVWTAEKGDYLTSATAASTYVAQETGKGLIDLTEYAAVKAAAESAVQTETDPVWTAEKGDYLTSATAASTYETIANVTAVAGRVTTLEGSTNTWNTAATTASANAALLAAIADVETDDISTLNEVIAAVKAIVAAAAAE